MNKSDGSQPDKESAEGLMRAELLRLQEWFKDRDDRPGSKSQYISIGMVLSAADRVAPSAGGPISDARIKELVRNVFIGVNCPDVSSSECIEYAIRKAVEEATSLQSASEERPRIEHLRMQIGYIATELMIAGDRRSLPEIVEQAEKATADRTATK